MVLPELGLLLLLRLQTSLSPQRTTTFTHRFLFQAQLIMMHLDRVRQISITPSTRRLLTSMCLLPITPRLVLDSSYKQVCRAAIVSIMTCSNRTVLMDRMRVFASGKTLSFMPTHCPMVFLMLDLVLPQTAIVGIGFQLNIPNRAKAVQLKSMMPLGGLS